MIYMLFLGTPKKSDIFFIISLFALPCFGSDFIEIIISFPFTWILPEELNFTSTEYLN